MQKVKLTEPMKRVLLNLHAGRSTTHGLRTMSEHGGHFRTLMGLFNRGLIDREDQLTPKGRDVAAGLVG